MFTGMEESTAEDWATIAMHFAAHGKAHLGMDRNLREEFRGHPGFERTALFCERYDSPAFDPAGETLPLEHFEPMVRRLFEAPRQTLYTGMISPGNEPAHS